MHVLYIIDSLVPSGAERSLATLAPAYRERGVDLDVAYLQERQGLQDDLRAAGAGLFSLDGPGGRLGGVRRARKLIDLRRPDLVHTTLAESDIAGRIAARAASVPVVSSLVNLRYGPEQLADPLVPAWKSRAAWLADRLTARWAVRFHAITGYIADAMSRILAIPRERIDVVPRGRPAEELGIRTRDRRRGARQALNLDAKTPLLLAVARHDRQKGLDVLLWALPAIRRKLPAARLVVAGRPGSMTSELHDLVRRLGLAGSVTFLGQRQDVPELLCGADVFVFPSRWEGLGSVLLEAMALEIPVVAADIPPVREVLGNDGELAALVPPGNVEELATSVVDALSDRKEARERTARARRRFLDRFTIDQVADQMVAFYRRSLAG